MLGPEDDSGEVKEDLAELEKKWSTFQMQVGQAKKSIELSIVFFKLVDEVSSVLISSIINLKEFSCILNNKKKR